MDRHGYVVTFDQVTGSWRDVRLEGRAPQPEAGVSAVSMSGKALAGSISGAIVVIVTLIVTVNLNQPEPNYAVNAYEGRALSKEPAEPFS